MELRRFINDFLEKGRKNSVNHSDCHVTVSSTGNIFLFSTWNTYRRYPANTYCTYGLINHFINKYTCLSLHIHASVRENETKQVTEDVHHRDSFHFSGIALKKELSDLEFLQKFCGRIKNLISVFCFMWYTWHGINLLAVWLYFVTQLYHMQVIYALFYVLKYWFFRVHHTKWCGKFE